MYRSINFTVAIKFSLYKNCFFSYDVSFVDGSNIPITIKPIDGTYEHHDGQYNCAAAGECSRDLRHVVDDSLKFVVDGHVVGTKSACSATHEPKFCCTGEYNKPETCKKSNFPDKYYGDLKKVCKFFCEGIIEILTISSIFLV